MKAKLETIDEGHTGYIWLTEWLSESLTDRIVSWLDIDWQICWHAEWLSADWPIADWLNSDHWIIELLVESLID